MQTGIETLKKDLTILAKLVKSVDAALEDGKISLAEGIGAAFKAIDLISVIKSLKDARQEVADLTQAEMIELAEHFKKEFDLRNEKAEEMAETIVELALQVAFATDLFEKFKTE